MVPWKIPHICKEKLWQCVECMNSMLIVYHADLRDREDNRFTYSRIIDGTWPRTFFPRLENNFWNNCKDRQTLKQSTMGIHVCLRYQKNAGTCISLTPLPISNILSPFSFLQYMSSQLQWSSRSSVTGNTNMTMQPRAAIRITQYASGVGSQLGVGLILLQWPRTELQSGSF